MTAPRPDGGFASISGAPLYYDAVGAGRPLVLIHEGIADHRMYDDQVAAFAARHRVIRYDVHGFGQSGLPPGPYTNHGALCELLRDLGVERTAILGMSMGGGIAVDFALAYPAMVDALILAASGLGGYHGSDAARQETERQWAAIGAALEAGDQPLAVELTLRMWLDGPHRTPDQVDPRIRQRVGATVADWCSWPRGRAQPLEPPAIDRLGEIAVPTLVLVGDGDQPDILSIADLLSQGIAGARRVVIPGVAHMPNIERPALFNRLVLEFLGA